MNGRLLHVFNDGIVVKKEVGRWKRAGGKCLLDNADGVRAREGLGASADRGEELFWELSCRRGKNLARENFMQGTRQEGAPCAGGGGKRKEIGEITRILGFFFLIEV